MTCGASTVSTAKVRKPRLMRLLDGIPPDTRVVIMDSRVAFERRLREWLRNEFGHPVNG
jgi:hypothetical protein